MNPVTLKRLGCVVVHASERHVWMIQTGSRSRSDLDDPTTYKFRNNRKGACDKSQESIILSSELLVTSRNNSTSI
jgi:hypothetical protein